MSSVAAAVAAVAAAATAAAVAVAVAVTVTAAVAEDGKAAHTPAAAREEGEHSLLDFVRVPPLV